MKEIDYEQLTIGDKVVVVNGEEYSHFKNGSIVTVYWFDRYRHILFEADNGTRQYLLPEHIEKHEDN